MNDQTDRVATSRRDLLRMIGVTAGASAMYQAMSTLGHAGESTYAGPPDLQGAPPGTSVLVLGAGIAGMTAAYELQKAGYKVQVLEFNNRAGGRNWSVRGGDSYTELGGERQDCQFDKDLYLNPGPWRIPYHHRGMLDLCRRLGVKLEPFVQVNHNAYLHNTEAFGGKPQRYRDVFFDYQGHVAELLAKAAHTSALDAEVSTEDKEWLLESLREWGTLDKDFRYVAGAHVSDRRGWKKARGGGLSARPTPSEVVSRHDILKSRLWAGIPNSFEYDMQTTIFQPVGGMGRVGEAFGRELGPIIKYQAKVTSITQDARGVTVMYDDLADGGAKKQAAAAWCVVTIPLPILGQIPMNVGPKLTTAIAAIPYASSIKVGLQFKRRFWEEDEQIYGGITYTNLPIGTIGYPNTDFQGRGKGVLLGCYIWGLAAMEFTSLTPEQRIQETLRQGARIHPQYPQEFDNGFAMAWHRSPFTMGCMGVWNDEARAEHYDNLCALDGRIVLAGEHASFMGGWQEGSVTSALDAIGRIHQRVVTQGSSKGAGA
ncbi:MAG: flavin monoamine oxidase family protein [Proteobacteria bacterium]|nr:flavin monoamine oxidase family protein [Pseudomonadota bacterium]